MKKSLLALAALTAFTGAASAQSSVTLFGVVDLAARGVSAGGRSQKQLVPDGMNSDRLGFRGIEDIGGGLRAGFWLEAGMDPSIGTAGGGNGNATGNTASALAPAGSPAALFNRRATVSLLGGFGEIRLGRDYTPSFWNTTVFDPFGTNGVGSFLNVVEQNLGSGAQTFVRANNTIGYFLPGGLGGLYGQAMVSAAEQSVAGLPVGNKHQSVRLGYAAGPVNVAFSTGTTKATADYKHSNFAGMYDLGVAKLMGQYNKVSSSNGRSQKAILLGVSVPVGTNEVRASYVTVDSSPAATYNRDAKQMSVGYIHNLSKRTALYGTYSRINNSGAGVYSHWAIASSVGGTSTGYEVGVRHSF
ncbi:MAG: porin [Rubrivivax sp.]